MKKYLLYLVILPAIFIFTSCNLAQKVKKDNSPLSEEVSRDSIIDKHFSKDDSIQAIPSKDGNYILYIAETKENPGNPVKDIQFIVYDQTRDSLIYQNNFSNASIQWHSNTQLILTRFYGISNDPEGSNIKHHLVDITTGKITDYQENSTIK
ncbi:MAG: hypothetical protein V2I54_00550 [Bacteroidales bacterium]|jgi:hypothetical protein|nr:hypothetical protein [Bacteroidales bacterium]